MEFEWDEAKRQQTIAQRDIDFRRVILIFEDAAHKTIVDDRRDQGEVRYPTMGRIGDDTFIVAHTRRGAKTRIITAWKAGQHGQSRFAKIHGGRNQRDE